MTGFAAMVAALAVVAPASAQEVTGYPDLQVSAQFDQPAYDSGDEVHVTVTITNAGDGATEDTFVFMDWSQTSLQLDPPGWGDLYYGGQVVRLAPGATMVVELTGTIWNPAAGVVTLSGEIRPWGPYDRNPEDNYFALSAPVTMTYGDFGGTVIEDRNGNGLADPGEGVGGVKVFLYGGAPIGDYEQVTDAQGRFFFEDLPSGRYASYYYSEDGWVVGPDYPNQDHWTIDEPGVLNVVVLAVRPLSDELLVTAAFQYDTYQVGDEAHVALTLRNRTDSTLTGIHAHCNGIGDSNQFNGIGPGWVAFDQSGPGVTLAAGETRTFDVYEAVPAGALEFGYVALGCEIGPGAGTGVRGLPDAVAQARVPGLTTTVPVRIVYDIDEDGWIEEGEGIAETGVALLDYGTHNVVARSISDAEGRFQFANIPTGLYVLRITGPWQLRGNPGQQLLILRARPGSGYEAVFGMEPRGSR
jgi:hypothetical protein